MKQKSTKHLRVTHKHRKPYRKRHFAVFIASIALAVTLVNGVILYSNNQERSTKQAQQTIADVFGSSKANNSVIRSSYGFSLSYNQRELSASAIDATSGDLYVDQELTTARAYSTLRLSSRASNTADASDVRITYYPDGAASSDLARLERDYIVAAEKSKPSLEMGQSTTKMIDGIVFRQTQWTRKLITNGIALTTQFSTYVGIVRDHPMAVIIYRGLAGEMSNDSIVDGLSFREKKQASAPSSHAVTYASATVFDQLLGIKTAGAAAPSYSASERVSATYGAAVVKIYNIQVGNLAIDKKTIIKDHVAGGTGSGFIVSHDGYIATNGHVAVIDPREELVTAAIKQAQAGDQTLLMGLIQLSGAKQSDIAGAASDKEVVKILIKKIYDIPASRFSFENTKQNLLVSLGDDQINLSDIYKRTFSRQSYPTSNTLKAGTLKRSDYDGTILPSVLNQFKKSDVAIVKIEGDRYPMVRLGVMQSAQQGSNLNIIGFPGVGASNGIVSEVKTSSTLTTGKVSALKTDTGGHNLIETDTEIGHGNSGGPAFNDSGEVVGIATYAVDPGGSGDGTLNYIRDIKDFKDIARAENVDFTPSQTQQEWNKALDSFYTARYKKSLGYFAEVERLYPNHPRVAELTSVAKSRIAAGENVDDFPIAWVVGGAVTVLLSSIGSAVAIYIHRRKHRALTQAIAAGTAQVTVPGAPAQYVPVVPKATTATSSFPTDSHHQH